VIQPCGGHTDGEVTDACHVVESSRSSLPRRDAGAEARRQWRRDSVILRYHRDWLLEPDAIELTRVGEETM